MARIRVPKVQEMRDDGTSIAMVTAYDAPFARAVDEAGIPLILVGDSVGMVVLGYETTLPVTMEDMIHHTKAVVAATSRAMVIADMPFLSYQVSVEQAIINAGRLVQEGGAQAVKLEGGAEMASRIEAIVNSGIPVMGHVGLTPQAVHRLGGYRTQGRDEAAARKLVEDAKAVEAAGAFSLVIEAVPEEVGRMITEAVTIPTIGIGAGRYTSGQVLVIYDMLGFTPKPAHFVRVFGDVRSQLVEALKKYRQAVESREFPGENEVTHADWATTGKPEA